MSRDWASDINDMHAEFGFHDSVEDMDSDQLRALLEFRLRFLEEELNETRVAAQNNWPDEIVDGLIDLCVVAIGTLDLFNVSAHDAWDRVHEANMSKERGIKESRPNPLGLPDLIKPAGWQAPEHEDNVGLLAEATS